MPTHVSLRLAAALLPLAAPGLAAQPAASPPVGITVSGVVYDSLARAPLAGAEVQLVDAAGGRSLVATADADGRYHVDSVPAGRYLVGFFHPRTDSLGIGVAPVAVTVSGEGTARVNLAFPSAAGVRRQLCSASENSDTTALLVGFVRDAATRAPLQGAAVRVQWSELVIAGTTVRNERPELVVRTRGDGWYGVCGVPTTGDGDVGLVAESGADTSGVVPLRLGAARVARRDLYVGRAAGTGAAVIRVRGVVRTARGTPLADARIQLLGDSAVATSDEAGGFTLAGRFTGSRLLLVRALGYVPAEVAVDLLASEEPATVAVTMTSAKAYLDTVRVTARSSFDADRNGFDRRRRTEPAGYFLDRAAIARRTVVHTTQLFSGVAGVRFDIDRYGQPHVRMRGIGGGSCTPEVYVDRMLTGTGPMLEGGLNEIDLFTTPKRLHGVEIYRDRATTPPEFNTTGSQCGAIVIWTRPRDPKPVRDGGR